MRLRVADREDAVALAAVHALAFASPWPPEAFVGLLGAPGVFALAAVDNAVVALILMRAIAGEAEVLTLAAALVRRRRAGPADRRPRPGGDPGSRDRLPGGGG